MEHERLSRRTYDDQGRGPRGCRPLDRRVLQPGPPPLELRHEVPIAYKIEHMSASEPARQPGVRRSRMTKALHARGGSPHPRGGALPRTSDTKGTMRDGRPGRRDDCSHCRQPRTRRFGDLVAVNDLTFEVPAGGVAGFVGPNGSGKSTMIRVLLGLIAASSGTGTVLGEPIEKPQRFAGRVGALIETPAFVGSLSARDNLRSLAALRGLPSSDRRGVGDRRADGTRQRSSGDVFAWHEAATRHRRCTVARSRAADPGRADEWTRPSGHRRGPNAAHESGRRPTNGCRVFASARRDRGDGRLPRRHPVR